MCPILSHLRKDIAQRLAKGPTIHSLKDWIYGAVTTFAIISDVVSTQLRTGMSWLWV